jgi:hypothetical protein
MDAFTLFLILIWIPLLVLALPIFQDVYRFLTRSKRKAITRARLARLPPPEEALENADREEVVAYLRKLFADDGGDDLDDEEVKARFEEVVRIVERRTSGKAAAAS